jgi:hypothetical protein
VEPRGLSSRLTMLLYPLTRRSPDHALGTSPSSVQSFRSRNAIYRRGGGSTLYDPKDFSSYEGVLEPAGPGVWFDPDIGSDPRWQKRWNSIERVELRLTPTRFVFLRRGGAGGQANR